MLIGDPDQCFCIHSTKVEVKERGIKKAETKELMNKKGKHYILSMQPAFIELCFCFDFFLSQDPIFLLLLFYPIKITVGKIVWKPVKREDGKQKTKIISCLLNLRPCRSRCVLACRATHFNLQHFIIAIVTYEIDESTFISYGNLLSFWYYSKEISCRRFFCGGKNGRKSCIQNLNNIQIRKL